MDRASDFSRTSCFALLLRLVRPLYGTKEDARSDNGANVGGIKSAAQPQLERMGGGRTIMRVKRRKKSGIVLMSCREEATRSDGALYSLARDTRSYAELTEALSLPRPNGWAGPFCFLY